MRFRFDFFHSSKEYVYIKETEIKRKLIFHNKERKKWEIPEIYNKKKQGWQLKKFKKLSEKGKLSPKISQLIK